MNTGRTHFKKGNIPWNKGKPISKETRKKVSIGLKKAWKEKDWSERNKKISLKMKGRIFTEEHKNNIKKNHKGMSGKKVSEETKRKMSESHKGNKCFWFGKKMTQEQKKILSKTHLGHKHTKEQIRKILRRRLKSSLEIKFEEIINKNKLPYKFVGNGKFFIERKNPDFINTNSEKIAIEVYDKRHKDKFRKGGTEGWKIEREKVFNKYGWQLLFFDILQINESYILKTLKGGN